MDIVNIVLIVTVGLAAWLSYNRGRRRAAAEFYCLLVEYDEQTADRWVNYLSKRNEGQEEE